MYEASVVNLSGKSVVKVLTSENVLKVLSKRDLKIIDERKNFRISTLVSNSEPDPKWILCKFDYLRALIFPNEVAVFHSHLTANQVSINKFIQQLVARIREENLDHKEQVLASIPVSIPASISPSLPASNPASMLTYASAATVDQLPLGAYVDVNDRKKNVNVVSTGTCCMDCQFGVGNFSFLVLETCLKHIDDYYDSLVEEVRPEIASLMNCINANCSSSGVDSMTKNQLTGLQHRFLNLEYKIKDINELFRDINKWEETEIREFNISGHPELDQRYLDLIEGYGKYYEETSDEIEKMGKTLDFAMRIIDTNILIIRNRYAKYDIHLQMMTLAFTAGTFVTSLFGMNLTSHLESNPYAFYICTFLVCLLFIIVFVISRCLFSQYIS